MDVQLPIEAKDIQKLIPHRYPFLQLDRITAFESMKTLTAIKNVTMNEPQFQGHFPDLPVRPAVLIIDDFAMREHTTTGSDDLYDLVSDRAIAGKPLILTSNRAPKDWYPLFPNPVVAESLLDGSSRSTSRIVEQRSSVSAWPEPALSTT